MFKVAPAPDKSEISPKFLLRKSREPKIGQNEREKNHAAIFFVCVAISRWATLRHTMNIVHPHPYNFTVFHVIISSLIP